LRLGAVLLALAALVAAPGAASAQQLPGFLLERFNPAGAGSDWFTLESLDFRGESRPAIGLVFDWSHNPFVLEDVNGDQAGAIVGRQVLLHLGLSLNIASRLRLGLNMPFAVNQKGMSATLGGITYPDPSGSAPGDFRAGADLRLFGQYGDPVTVAIGAQLFFPTGKEDHYLGDHVIRFHPRLLIAGEAGVFAYSAAFGFLSRDAIDDGYFQGYGIGHELFGGLALGIKPTPEVLLGAEIASYSKVTGGDFLRKRSTPTEILFGVHFNIADQFRLGLGAGPGITPSKGSPAVRVLANLAWFPSAIPPDRDGDSIRDDVDACPDTPGIRTDDPATTGCPPPPDRDNDGIIDSQDACPDEAGLHSPDPSKNGCPLPKDRDGDGVADPVDACPDEKGVATDDPKTNGCPPPPPDQDKDGVPDAQDACPDKPGDRTDDPKTNGCPDSDMDGIRDPEDACPNVSGPRDPDPKKNGCPLARVEQGQVKITEQVKFKTGSATILPESDTLLNAVAKILKDHPEIKKVQVQGHTDNRGGKSMNQRLSERRAASVAKWLVTKGGVEKSRLTSEGFGMDRPIADNATDEGRRDNRRVEFHITDPAPAAPAPPP
jgi:outer membrane protein OmpA-like peptidoglycan-associated protein